MPLFRYVILSVGNILRADYVRENSRHDKAHIKYKQFIGKKKNLKITTHFMNIHNAFASTFQNFHRVRFHESSTDSIESKFVWNRLISLIETAGFVLKEILTLALYLNESWRALPLNFHISSCGNFYGAISINNLFTPIVSRWGKENFP